MSKRFFRLNDDKTISLAYENLNPTEVQDLIDRLKGNLWFIRQASPSIQEVLLKSMRRVGSEISFQYSWEGPVHTIDLDDYDPENPDAWIVPPNFALEQEVWSDARQFIIDCLEAE